MQALSNDRIHNNLQLLINDIATGFCQIINSVGINLLKMSAF